MSITVNPIGHVRSSRSEMRDDHWDAETTSVVLDGDAFGPDALLGLDSFSHIEVVYFFDQVDPAKIETGTPVIDIKPVMSAFAPRGEVREPAWAAELMREYWGSEG